METHGSLEALIRAIFTITSTSASEWNALCPVHDDRNPSARVNPGKGMWYCHSCHKGGSIVALAYQLGHDVPDSISEWLVTHDLDQALEALTQAPEPATYPEAWLARFQALTDYWSKTRSFSADAIEHWKLGYDVRDGYATYPLRDASGAVLGVSKRATTPEQEAERKHKHPRGYVKTRHLFGAWESEGTLHDESARLPGTLVITEGAMDAISMWDAGYASVAQLGSTLSGEQIAIIKELEPSEVCLAYDADAAGRQNTIDAWWQLQGVILTQAKIPPGFDPGELSIPERRQAMDDRRLLLTEPQYRCATPSRFAKKKAPARSRSLPRKR